MQLAYCRLGKEDGDKLRQNIPVHNFIAPHLKAPVAHVSATKHKKNESWGEKARTKTRGAGERKGEGKDRGGGRAVDKALRPLFRTLVIILTISTVNRDV